MSLAQPTLFGEHHPELPEGMKYTDDIVSPAEEKKLVAFITTLPLKPFEFVGGLKGNRRVVSFGWRYDFGSHTMDKAEAIPDALIGLRDKAAAFAGLPAERMQHALVTEYAPGAGIGWHKDRPVFEQVVGISLVAPCLFRLRRKAGAKWERKSFTAHPRSAYLLSGASRHGWEHSIPPMRELRYSVTFRSLHERA
jgi:alkylated DNA repair dioxygenase AlkB